MDALRAAYALRKRGVDSIAPLLEALRSDHPDAPRNAACGLNAMGPVCVSSLVDAISASSAVVRARIFDVLGDMGSSATEAVPALLRGLEGPDDDARGRAAEAIGTTGGLRSGLGKPLVELDMKDEITSNRHYWRPSPIAVWIAFQRLELRTPPRDPNTFDNSLTTRREVFGGRPN